MTAQIGQMSRTVRDPLVRVARADEAAGLADLHRRCFTRGWPADEIARLVAQPNAIALVGERDSRLAGFILARTAADETEILTIAVESRHRRRGVASALLAGAMAAAARHGARTVFLEVAAGNHAARVLYDRADFAEIGRRPRYYASTDADSGEALVLARRLERPVDAAARHS